MASSAAVLATCCVLAGAHPAAASPLQSIAIPAYFYPSYPDPLWTQMEQAAPTVSFAVMNPANGAGPVPDSPKIAITPNLIDFGIVPVGSMSDKVKVSIANTGTAVLSVTRLDITGTDAGDFTSDDMPGVLPKAVMPGVNPRAWWNSTTSAISTLLLKSKNE